MKQREKWLSHRKTEPRRKPKRITGQGFYSFLRVHSWTSSQTPPWIPSLNCLSSGPTGRWAQFILAIFPLPSLFPAWPVKLDWDADPLLHRQTPSRQTVACRRYSRYRWAFLQGRPGAQPAWQGICQISSGADGPRGSGRAGAHRAGTTHCKEWG
jgi:hypothetical protein